MLDSLELFLIGFACVVDTVLLLVVRERINHAQVAVWLKLSIAGNWLVHVASFFHLMLKSVESTTGVFLDQICMTLISAGLLILPSAILHGAIRLNHTGVTVHPRIDRRYSILYLPLFMVLMAAWLAFHNRDRDFVHAVSSISQLYLVWIVVANSTSVFLFLQARTRLSAPGAPEFLQRLSIAILAITLLVFFYVLWFADTEAEFWVRLMIIMSPLFPAFLFVWYILRQRLLPLVVERTFVYGAFLAIMLLLHRVTITPWTSAMRERSNLDFVLIEWILVFGFIMSWRPLRERVRASLRYLLSNDVFYIRDATRLLSVELSQQTERNSDELVSWFSAAVKEKIAVEFVAIEFLNSQLALHTDGSANVSSTKAQNGISAANVETHATFAEQKATLLRSSTTHPMQSAIGQVLQYLLESPSNRSTGYINRGVEPQMAAAMEMLHADSIFRVSFRSVQGVAILGTRLRSDRLAQEQLTALAMLFDQFAATLYNRKLESQRLWAERQSMQQEKLSVLGLIAGSLAHEIRNPLSSIRTIATLMKEDMQDGDEHLQDVSMIVSEIDRLSQTTQRLLDYAKPCDTSCEQVNPDHVIERLLHILVQLARQHSVEIVQRLGAAELRIAATDATLSEILFNLIRNAIEAACEVEHGQVIIESTVVENSIVVTVSDNGHGINPSLRDNLFHPFVTGKADGTGLGLYIAAERVRELSGTLRCESQDGQGSVFEVRLPLVRFPLES